MLEFKSACHSAIRPHLPRCSVILLYVKGAVKHSAIHLDQQKYHTLDFCENKQ